MNIQSQEAEDEDVDWDDSYDQYGRPTPGGLYDAGGHVIAEKWAAYADFAMDERKYRN